MNKTPIDSRRYSRLMSDKPLGKNEFRGVSLNGKNRWRGNLYFMGKTYHTEPYDTPEEAYKAYKELKKDVAGEWIEQYEKRKKGECQMEKFSSWEEVFEALSEEEKNEIRKQVADTCGQENVNDEKICNDVGNYFDEFVGDSTTNCYNNNVPDVIDGRYAYTKKNFLWALS